jgi:hypothetical protein
MISAIPAVSTICHVDFRSSCFFFEAPMTQDSRSRAQALEASMHTLTTMSRSATIFGFFIAISSIVLISLTPSQKALMILMSWMHGIAFLAL